MPAAEILTIGTELLLGEIVDTNAYTIARTLRDMGIDLYRHTTVGDNSQRIAQALREALERCEIVITTGGLGPTVDDPTREAVALALGRQTEFRPELWEQIQARFQRFRREPTENNRRQAFVPVGAIGVENPVGTAPAFIVELERSGARQAVIALPGVPREMEYLLAHAVMPYLNQRYNLRGVIKTRLLHTAGVGESQIDDIIGDLEELSNPTVGLAAHSGQVDVRITAKADSEAEAEAMIAPVEAELRARLGKWVYGVDAETLEGIALGAVAARGWSLAVVEAGLGGELVQRLAAAGGAFQGGEVLAHGPAPQDLPSLTTAACLARQAEVGLGIALYPDGDTVQISLAVITPEGEKLVERPFGGPPEYAPRWAVHHGLALLRRQV
jgi:nicotinamide-nucleotide amidase